MLKNQCIVMANFQHIIIAVSIKCCKRERKKNIKRIRYLSKVELKDIQWNSIFKFLFLELFYISPMVNSCYVFKWKQKVKQLRCSTSVWFLAVDCWIKFSISAYLAMICTFLVYLTHGWDTTRDTYVVFNWK